MPAAAAVSVSASAAAPITAAAEPAAPAAAATAAVAASAFTAAASAGKALNRPHERCNYHPNHRCQTINWSSHHTRTLRADPPSDQQVHSKVSLHLWTP